MIPPIELLKSWLTEEQHAGAPNPRQAILATCAKDAIPHARVLAIREIDESGLLFFTQKGTRKVNELIENPLATIIFWFELYQREVIIEGAVASLPDEENERYWQSNPREQQIRFTSYASTSAQPIAIKEVLVNRKMQIEREFEGIALPISLFYYGFRLKPERILFYATRTDKLSDVFEYRHYGGVWTMQWLSP